MEGLRRRTFDFRARHATQAVRARCRCWGCGLGSEGVAGGDVAGSRGRSGRGALAPVGGDTGVESRAEVAVGVAGVLDVDVEAGVEVESEDARIEVGVGTAGTGRLSMVFRNFVACEDAEGIYLRVSRKEVVFHAP